MARRPAPRAMPEGWPPADSVAFVTSAAFLEAVYESVARLVDGPFRADAAALVIDWFENRAIEDSRWFDRFPTERSWTGYLRTSVIHAGQHAARLRERERSLEALPADWGFEELPVDRLVEEEERAQLVAALRELPGEDQRLVRMMLEGQTVTEMAGRLGITKQSVSTRLARIADRLRRRLRG